MPYRFLLFDLDGTLIDPEVGITRAVAHALAAKDIHISEAELNTLTPFIGPPLVESFQQFYDFDKTTALEAVVKYREYYAVTGLYECTVYPGIPEMLESLALMNVPIYLATSKPAAFAEKILTHFDLLKYFTRIAGSELDHSRIHKADVISWLLEQEGLDAREALMVGDRIYDIEGARACGIETVAVSYGYGSNEEFNRAAPAYRADSVPELTALLVALLLQS
jgi:phosphoglycolate phosphatase